MSNPAVVTFARFLLPSSVCVQAQQVKSVFVFLFFQPAIEDYDARFATR